MKNMALTEKESDKVDHELVEQFRRSLEDLKAGRVKRVR